MSTASFPSPSAGVIARAADIHLPSQGVRPVEFNPLPGIVIFVHGVNSNGEWFDAAEQGLCEGLNVRLHRSEFGEPQDASISGLLRAAQYRTELTPKGFLTRAKSEEGVRPEEFVSGAEGSPVIRFRWGYAANKADLKKVGGSILLDEDNAWGGGPFANGCTALPDLWSQGTLTDLLAGLQAQDINTENSRLVYSCPGRQYGAHAAWRLAVLVKEARERHESAYGKECPVTIVCHSQGNMVGIASAFIGQAKLGGKGVADTYVLANPPYSVLPNFFDNFAQYDGANDLGRVTVLARRKTLDKFFAIVRDRNSNLASADCVNGMMGNNRKPWELGQDQQKFPTHKRVFLYANPHDQVISVSTVMGIGWMGLPQAVLSGEDEDMRDEKNRFAFSHANGVLHQRIWAQGNPGKYGGDRQFKVGEAGQPFVYYDKHNASKADPIQGPDHEFWFRKPLAARFHVRRVWQDDQRGVLPKVGATLLGGFYELGFGLISVLTGGKVSYMAMNATPPDRWTVTIDAHPVPNPIVPSAIHLYHKQTDATGQQPADDGQVRVDGVQGKPGGKVSGVFDQGPESHTDSLNTKARTGDVYDEYRKAGQGAESDEAALRYEHNADVRQLARRKAGNPYEAAVGQMNKDGDLSGDEYKEFRKFDRDKREYFLKEATDLNATNHSTILTNPAHCRQVLAYDVGVGLCAMPLEQMNWLRQLADWRYCDPKDLVMADWSDYYQFARVDGGKMLKDHPYYKPEVPATLDVDTERANISSLTQGTKESQGSRHSRPDENGNVFGGGRL